MELYWDWRNGQLSKELGRWAPVQQIQIALRDLWPVELRLAVYNVSEGAYVIEEAPAGFLPLFCAKPAAALAGDALVFQGDWPLTGTGTEALYAADISANTEALIAAASTTNPFDLVGEFTLADANGNQKSSTQFLLRIVQDVYRGNEQAPIASAGPSPFLQWFTDESGARCVRLLSDLDGSTIAVFKPAGV